MNWSNPEECAKKMVGNWKSFESFFWHGQPEDADKYCIVYTHNRDSGLLEQSNAEVIEKELEKFPDDVIDQHHNHWACGWVDGYAIRVYRDGQVTPAFEKWCEIQESLGNYPVLNEEDYSNKQYEATCENIKSEAARFVRDDFDSFLLDADWPDVAFGWWWDNNQSAIENRDDRGGCPSDDDFVECFLHLCLLSIDYKEEAEEYVKERAEPLIKKIYGRSLRDPVVQEVSKELNKLDRLLDEWEESFEFETVD
jgi:hypothetical protein